MWTDPSKGQSGNKSKLNKSEGLAQTSEIADQANSFESSELYGELTADFTSGEICLWVITATSVERAEAQLKRVGPLSEHFGVFKLNIELGSRLLDIVRADWAGVFALSFQKSPAHCYEFIGMDLRPTTGSAEAFAALPNRLRLFACLGISRSFGIVQLLFVQAVDGDRAHAQIRAMFPGKWDIFVVDLNRKVIGALSRMFELHEANKISYASLNPRRNLARGEVPFGRS